jgi:spermidine synthase
MDIKGTCLSLITDAHGPIYVFQTKNRRILSFDGKIYQSCMKLNDINGLHLGYTQAMMTGLLFIPTLENATIMGLGAGSMAKKLLSSFQKLHVTVIEYREAVINMAKKYFYLPEDKRLTIHVDDAINHIKNTPIKSDIIFSDLFSAQGMEPKQVQKSFLRDCKNALNNQGVLVLNIWHTSENLKDELRELLAFEFNNQFLSFNVESGNTIVLAFKNKIPALSKEELLVKSQQLQTKMNINLQRYAELLCS